MANKKINQLVLKTTIQSTDLFPLGDATTGQLFKKTIAELQAAIGGAVISVNGLVGTVVLDTDDIQELATPTNKYFTDARARGAISLTVAGNSGASTYNNSTGVLNVPTYTLAGLGGITASFLSGASGIAYNSSTGVITYTGTVFTDASIRALFSAGTGISYNSSTGAISYSGTVYTDASIRALISLTTSGSSGASTYNNTTGVLNVPTYTLAGLGGISLASLSGSAPITYNSSTGAIGITQASGSTNGYLSSSDWTTFNSKQSALTLGNVTEVASNVLMFPDGGTNKTVGNLSIQVVQAGSTTNGYLSTTDWNTFNNKQNAITLTTTGTSGAATFSAGTLNIPQYQSALTNPVTGTGTTNYVTKWTSSSAIGNSTIFDNGTNVGVGTATPADFIDASSGLAIIASSGRSGLSLGSTQGTADEALGRLSFTNTNSSNAGGKRLAFISGIRGTTNNSAYLEFGTANDGLGTQRMVISQTGNVGIGTATPSTKLHVYEALTNGTSYLTIQNNRARNAAVYTVTSNGGFYAGTSIGTDTFNYQIYDAVVGAARLTISSAGNVGIGTSSPTGKFSVNTGASNQIAFFNNSSSGSTYNLISLNGSYSEGTNMGIEGGDSGDANLYVNGGYTSSTNGGIIFRSGGASTYTERMRITSGGNLLVGGGLNYGRTTISTSLAKTSNTFSADASALHLTTSESDTPFGIKFFIIGNSTSSARRIEIQTGTHGIANEGNISLQSAGGNILIGTTTDNGERLYVSGSIRATGSITANSDARLKKNIERIENALEKVGQISGYTYNTIYDEDRHAGVIAQEVDKVLPEIVNKGNDGLMGVEYGNISALLIEAIKDLKKDNESLQARLTALEK